MTPPAPATLPTRFTDKTRLDGDCLVWTGCLNSRGYGCFGWGRKGRNVLAHRFAYEVLVGPIPDGLTVDHLCRRRTCVNVAHMEVVTNLVNVMRGQSPSAINARQTHCKNGHPFDLLNTYITSQGKRQCRACKRAQKVAA